MTLPRDVLERNLELLFARAYAPVRAPEEFRARLLRELPRRIAAPERARYGWRAAAAILVGIGLAFLAWRIGRSSGPGESVESLLAAGRVAVREGPGGDWRPLRPEEDRTGVPFAGPSLELATPRDHAARAILGSGGQVEAQVSSRFALERPGAEGGLVVSLASGGVSVERRGAGEAWRISTPEGSLRLEAGVLEVACLDLHGSPAARALLRSGAAALELDPHSPLVAGTEVWLQDGALVADGALDSPASAASQRTDAGPAAPPELPPAEPPPPPGGSLRGTLAVPSGASLPQSYLVSLLRRERLPQVGMADPHPSEGPRFAIDGLRPGSYTVFVEAPGYAVWQRADVELSAGAPPVVLEVVLDAGRSARGRVLDRDGRPVDGATVIAENDIPAQLLPFSLEQLPTKWIAAATTGADGSFELEHLSRGNHRLRASRAGHGATWSDVLDLSAGDASELTLRLVQPGALEGHVAQDDGAPWPGAVIVASWMVTSGAYSPRGCLNYASATADGEGHYAIEDLPPGQYVVLNVMEGRQAGATRIPRVQNVRVEAGVRTRVDLPGSGAGTAVAGTLVARDGAPLADLDVTFVPRASNDTDWKSTRSRADGRFEFPSLPPGPYAIYVGANLGAELAFQGEVEVPAVPSFVHTVHVGSGILRGGVLDARTGAGLASSAVILEVETGERPIFAARVVTDAQGRYVLHLLPAGKYRATAYAGSGRFGQETSAFSIDDAAPERELDFALRAGAGILVKVVDAQGRPLPGARLRFLDASDESFTFSPDDRTDAQGSLRILGVQPGRWTIQARADRFETTSTAIDLVADEDRTVEITLSASH